MNNTALSSISLLYQDQDGLESFLERNCIHCDPMPQWLVCIHTSIHTPKDAVAIAAHIAKLLPDAKIVGTSAEAVIQNGTIYDDRCLIIFTKFYQTDIQIHRFSLTQNSPEELARMTKTEAVFPNTKSMIAFFSDRYTHVQEYLDQLRLLDVSVPMTGGLASPNPHGEFVFDATGMQKDSFMLVSLQSAVLHTYHNIIQGHEPFSETYTITDAEECDLLRIENTPAVSWFREKLGIDYIKNDLSMQSLRRDILLHFPLILTDGTKRSRFIRYCEPRNQIETYSTQLDAGTKFQLGYLSPLSTAKEVNQIYNQLESTPCQAIFTYSCIFRKLYLNNCCEWELRLFRSCHICGAFLYGEISHIESQNNLFIGTNSLFGLSESDSQYLAIDPASLEDMQSLEGDWIDIKRYIHTIKQEQLSHECIEFSAKIMHQEHNLKNALFIDKETRLPNLVKFKYDNVKNQYDKICMVSIEKGALISGRRGTKVWNHLLREDIQQMRRMLRDDSLHFYCNDTWSFFIAAGKDYSDDLFLKKAEELFQKCGYYFCNKYNITAVNNFHVVIGEPNLLEKVQFCMSSNLDCNNRFVIYNADDSDLVQEIDEKLFMTNVISDAILYDRIVPYFQPIRDNRTKEICKYEALMRLADKDQRIYSPGQFLNIAKDYHLYLQLSQQMIQKVLDLFRNREESVFLNLSAYDISSSENRSFLYQMLSDLPPEACRRITFEILESEKIRDFGELVQFLNDIRKFGVKIAIDDFGSGYSNFTAIIQVNPDFIKIDGDLIINCDKDPVKKLCLQAITDIARGIHAELIAEHVENSNEQETVESVQIEYTQGYYFSKPLPYSSLDTVPIA